MCETHEQLIEFVREDRATNMGDLHGWWGCNSFAILGFQKRRLLSNFRKFAEIGEL